MGLVISQSNGTHYGERTEGSAKRHNLTQAVRYHLRSHCSVLTLTSCITVNAQATKASYGSRNLFLVFLLHVKDTFYSPP